MNKYHKLLSFSLIFLLLFLYSSFSTAEVFDNRWYQIELIVFSHINKQGINSEDWPMIVPTNFSNKNVVQLLNQNQTQALADNYELLSNDQFQLNREMDRLKRSSGYHVLLHIIWNQRVKLPSRAKPIHIYGGNEYTPSGKIIVVKNSPTSQTQDQSKNQSQPQPQPQSNLIWQTNGTITISVKKYFNVHLNLFFAEPLSKIISISGSKYFSGAHQGLVYFHLQQNRRMRSNELNYFDHPLYGVLVKITHIKHS